MKPQTCLRSRSSTAGLKLKPLERKETNNVKKKYQKVKQSVTKMTVVSIFESFIDTSEDDAEILDVSQHIRRESAQPVENYEFHEETDEDSGADEGLGSEIIDPKDVLSNIKETAQFSTKVNDLIKRQILIVVSRLRTWC